MILRLSFEEVTALNSAGERLLSSPGGGSVMAPPEALAELESRLPLEGDISVVTLASQARLDRALTLVLHHLRRRMDALIVDQYVGSDDSVNAYFDYAYVLATQARLSAIGHEMRAIADILPDAPEAPDEITFPD